MQSSISYLGYLNFSPYNVKRPACIYRWFLQPSLESDPKRESGLCKLMISDVLFPVRHFLVLYHNQELNNWKGFFEPANLINSGFLYVSVDVSFGVSKEHKSSSNFGCNGRQGSRSWEIINGTRHDAVWDHDHAHNVDLHRGTRPSRSSQHGHPHQQNGVSVHSALHRWTQRSWLQRGGRHLQPWLPHSHRPPRWCVCMHFLRRGFPADSCGISQHSSLLRGLHMDCEAVWILQQHGKLGSWLGLIDQNGAAKVQVRILVFCGSSQIVSKVGVYSISAQS